jgi:8-oxo-dGTP pyrophosphatase MutT (NUDIX family)
MKIEAAQRLLAGIPAPGKEGAGALFYCPETENFLLMLRSDDNTWCGLGGMRDDMEPLETTVRREAFEEAGLAMDAPYKLIPVTTVYHPNGFKFTNYLALIDEEFLPIINDEHRSFQWCRWQDFPKEMHPKMMEAFASPDGQKVLQHYTCM